MRVHYKMKMTDAIRNEIYIARQNNREIDFIEVTDEELLRLKRELAENGPTMPRRISLFQTQIKCMGVSVVKESPVDDEEEESF